MKIILILFAIWSLIIQIISAGCSDTKLFCFDLNNHLIGSIKVNQCWNWSRLTCLPCEAKTNKKVTSFDKYIISCQTLYPQSISVLVENNFKESKIKEMLNRIHFG